MEQKVTRFTMPVRQPAKTSASWKHRRATSGRRRRRRPDVEQALSKGKAFQAYQWTPVDLLFDRRHLT